MIFHYILINKDIKLNYFYMNNINYQLKHVLQMSKIDLKKEILQLQNLKNAHIYCKINYLSGQITGPLIENYILYKYNMKKINPSLCKGDCFHKDKNIEIKVSNGGKDNDKFNYVQLRMNHNIDFYILTAYYLNSNNLYNNGELFIFKLSKEKIKYIIYNYGSYAHGTIRKLGKISYEDLSDINNSKEYAIRTKYGDKCWKDLLQFRINECSI